MVKNKLSNKGLKKKITIASGILTFVSVASFFYQISCRPYIADASLSNCGTFEKGIISIFGFVPSVLGDLFGVIFGNLKFSKSPSLWFLALAVIVLAIVTYVVYYYLIIMLTKIWSVIKRK